jgi:hypothetical protein
VRPGRAPCAELASSSAGIPEEEKIQFENKILDFIISMKEDF